MCVCVCVCVCVCWEKICRMKFGNRLFLFFKTVFIFWPSSGGIFIKTVNISKLIQL